MDVVLYWKKLDANWIKSHPLKKLGCKMITLLDMPEEQAILEIYTLDGLIVEIGHATADSLQMEIKEVTKDFQVKPPIINSIGGFMDAMPLAGKDRYLAVKAAIPKYPKELAKKAIEQNLGFFWKGCLKGQGLKRGELLFVYDAMSFTLKKLINILAALNGLYFWAGEPRWIEFRAQKMKLCPPNLWPRIKRMYSDPPDKALSELERLQEEIIVLVSRHKPEVDMTRATKFDELRVQATAKRPRLKYQMKE
ncbi:MAG: hypothetical protein RDU76_01460 [Candidatus Edwardsbacteria bacterium]|nr:hypothetical protein [Candidatus Edwardsbacteria bacterium]